MQAISSTVLLLPELWVISNLMALISNTNWSTVPCDGVKLLEPFINNNKRVQEDKKKTWVGVCVCGVKIFVFV